MASKLCKGLIKRIQRHFIKYTNEIHLKSKPQTSQTLTNRQAMLKLANFSNFFLKTSLISEVKIS